MKKLYILGIAILVLGLQVPGVSAGEHERGYQTVCPVMAGDIDKSVYSDYGDFRVYFCCEGCKTDFAADPEKYLKKIRDNGETPYMKPGKGMQSGTGDAVSAGTCPFSVKSTSGAASSCSPKGGEKTKACQGCDSSAACTGACTHSS